MELAAPEGFADGSPLSLAAMSTADWIATGLLAACAVFAYVCVIIGLYHKHAERRSQGLPAKFAPRYVVRYRLGGRAYEHAGSFKTLKEARTDDPSEGFIWEIFYLLSPLLFSLSVLTSAMLGFYVSSLFGGGFTARGIGISCGLLAGYFVWVRLLMRKEDRDAPTWLVFAGFFWGSSVAAGACVRMAVTHFVGRGPGALASLGVVAVFFFAGLALVLLGTRRRGRTPIGKEG